MSESLRGKSHSCNVLISVLDSSFIFGGQFRVFLGLTGAQLCYFNSVLFLSHSTDVLNLMEFLQIFPLKYGLLQKNFVTETFVAKGFCCPVKTVKLKPV